MAEGESSTRFDSETYKKAQDALKNTEAPSLEKQIQLAREQEAAAKKVADNVIRSQGFAKKGSEELNLSRASAGDILKLGFEDFGKPIMIMSPDTKNPLTLNQKPTNTPPQIPEIGAQPIDFKNGTNTASETTRPAPKKIETQNDPLNVVGSGNLTSTETIQAAQQSINSGNTSPDNMQKVKDVIKDMFSSLPEGLKKFFGPFLAMFEKLSGIENKDSKIAEMIKDQEERKILEKYGIDVQATDKDIRKFTFLPGTTIVKEEKTQKVNVPGSQPEEKTQKVNVPGSQPVEITYKKSNIELKDNSLSIDFKDVESAKITDTQGGLNLTIKKKNGGIDTYTVKSDKKPAMETQKA